MSIKQIKRVAEQILSRKTAAQGKGESATKITMVMPMIEAMGYDIYDLEEVCPEYEADFATKKTGQKEKVDIAVFRDKKPVIYIEVKSVDTSLDKHEGQLARYFNSTTSVSLAILTNGVEWRLYTDTVETNKLDKEPFYVCQLNELEQGLDVLARFNKTADLNNEAVRGYASELKYTDIIAKFLRENFDLHKEAPKENLIIWILAELKDADKNFGVGRVNANVVARFQPIVKDALTRIVREIGRRSISAADEAAAPTVVQPEPVPAPAVNEEADPTEVASPIKAIVTTDDELAFFTAIEGIFNRSTFKGGMINEPGRHREIPIELGYKDTTAYFGVYFNKPGWWFMRVMLDGKNKWVGFDLPSEIGTPLIPEQIKILPSTAFASFRVAFNGLEDLRLLEPIILTAMERSVQQRATNQEINNDDAVQIEES
jgi:hypothetical protein